MTARLAGMFALFVLPLMAMPSWPQSAPTGEHDGYRMEDYRAPTPASLKGAVILHAVAVGLVRRGRLRPRRHRHQRENEERKHACKPRRHGRLAALSSVMGMLFSSSNGTPKPSRM